MKKIVHLLLFLFALGLYTSNAQIQTGLETGLQVPVAGFASPGFGFGASGKYSLKDNINVGANLHLNFFSGDYYDPYFNNNLRNKTAITSIKGLFEYYYLTTIFKDKLKPYAGGDIGFYFWREKGYSYWINPAGNPVYDSRIYNGIAFGIAPMGGVTYELTDKLVVDSNLKLNLLLTDPDMSYLGINFGLFYKLDL